MTTDRLIQLAESCSAVRSSIGRLLLSAEGSEERSTAVEAYERSLRELLSRAREEEAGLYLEVAGQLTSSS